MLVLHFISLLLYFVITQVMQCGVFPVTVGTTTGVGITSA